jgi:MYXO-CTERM domain-containing protein
MSTSHVFFLSAVSAAALAAVLSCAQPSRADVLPPDGCNGAAGTSCDNAGPYNDEPGICVNATCPHTTFGGPDGGVGVDATTEEPCVLCQAPDGGSSTGNGSSKSSSGGCSMSPGSEAGVGLGLMLAATVAVGALHRRRRAV